MIVKNWLTNIRIIIKLGVVSECSNGRLKRTAPKGLYQNFPLRSSGGRRARNQARGRGVRKAVFDQESEDTGVLPGRSLQQWCEEWPERPGARRVAQR